MSKAEGFGDVRFASPVTRNPNSDQERFNVQMQVDVEKLKKSFDALSIGKEEEKSAETEAPPPAAVKVPGEQVVPEEAPPPEEAPVEEAPVEEAPVTQGN